MVALDHPTSSARTQELLGWQPTHPGLIDDLGQGHYSTSWRHSVLSVRARVRYLVTALVFVLALAVAPGPAGEWKPGPAR